MKQLKFDERLIFSGFYFITGMLMLIILIMSNGTLIHIGLLGVLSMILSYGLNKMRRWALILLTILFFTGITLGAVTIYSSLHWFDPGLTATFLQAITVFYMMMLVISFFYVISEREKFE